MPTYDYACRACDHTWDEFQSIKASPTRKCPKCGKLKAERQISPGAGFLFKGSGFYITDYRSDSYKKSAAAETKPTSGGEGKSETKSASDSSSKPAAPAGDKS
jgi:putative FmdB family regulatory protein